MKLRLHDGLPYVSATLIHRGQRRVFKNVLLDTGSAGTIFSADKVATFDLKLETQDKIHRIRGVGGAEFVFTKRVDLVSIGDLKIKSFPLEIGAMDYGFEIDGIIGMDFLRKVGAVIDLDKFEIRKTRK